VGQELPELQGRNAMSDHVYKKVELTGSSKTSVEDAIQNAISVASRSLQHMDWLEVQEVRGDISDGAVGYYQVTLKVGFRLND
jgi:flavin-binding protein dodecin